MKFLEHTKKRISGLVARFREKFGHDSIEHNPSPAEEPQKTDYHHQQVLNDLLKTIANCPMDSRLKTILRMRVWGPKPDVFCPLDHRHIAAALKIHNPEHWENTALVKAIGISVKSVTGVEVRDVKRWEEDALYNMEQFLNKTGIVSISEKFLRDGNLKEILNQRKGIRG